MALGNGFGGLLGGTISVGNMGAYMSSTSTALSDYANMAAQQGYALSYAMGSSGNLTITTTPQQVYAIPATPEPRWKKAKSMVDRLRMEIDDWHGDVLGRCAA